MDLAAVKVNDPAKVGIDVGALCGMPPTAVRASGAGGFPSNARRGFRGTPQSGRCVLGVEIEEIMTTIDAEPELRLQWEVGPATGARSRSPHRMDAAAAHLVKPVPVVVQAPPGS